MLKPKSKRFVSKPLDKGYPRMNKTYHPLSYYVAGGSDVDGDALRPVSEPPMPDAEDDADTMMSNFGTDDDGNLNVPNDPFCDPRHDVFSLFGLTSSPAFQSAVKSGRVSRSKAPEKSGTESGSSTGTESGATE